MELPIFYDWETVTAEEGRAKKAAIAADRTVLDVYDRLKRRLGISDEVAHKVLRSVDKLRRKR